MRFFSQSTETQLRLIVAGLILAGCGAGGGGGAGEGGATIPQQDQSSSSSPAGDLLGGVTQLVAGVVVSLTQAQVAVYDELVTALGHQSQTPPKVRYEHATICHDGSVCCLVDHPTFSGYYDAGSRTIDLVIPEEAEPGCRDLLTNTVLRHEMIHDITQNFDHTDPAFCEYSNTCCPTPGHPVGECSSASALDHD